jgi:hypothetical protein
MVNKREFRAHLFYRLGVFPSATDAKRLPADWVPALFQNREAGDPGGTANAGGNDAAYLCCHGSHALGGASARADSNYDFPCGNHYRHQ